MTAIVYQTDLTNPQWELLQEHLPKPKSGPGKPGRPTIDIRQAINGILYLDKTGCQWRMLPREFGNWNSVYYYFKKWRAGSLGKRNGSFEPQGTRATGKKSRAVSRLRG